MFSFEQRKNYVDEILHITDILLQFVLGRNLTYMFIASHFEISSPKETQNFLLRCLQFSVLTAAHTHLYIYTCIYISFRCYRRTYTYVCISTSVSFSDFTWLICVGYCYCCSHCCHCCCRCWLSLLLRLWMNTHTRTHTRNIVAGYDKHLQWLKYKWITGWESDREVHTQTRVQFQMHHHNQKHMQLAVAM